MSDFTKFWLPLVITVVLGIIALICLDIGIKMKIIICLIALWLVALITAIFYGLDLCRKDKQLKTQFNDYAILNNEYINLYNIANEAINNLKTEYAQLTSYTEGLQLNNEELNKQLEKANKIIEGFKTPVFKYGLGQNPLINTMQNKTH